MQSNIQVNAAQTIQWDTSTLIDRNDRYAETMNLKMMKDTAL